jgi:hypothetical protein
VSRLQCGEKTLSTPVTEMSMRWSVLVLVSVLACGRPLVNVAAPPAVPVLPVSRDGSIPPQIEFRVPKPPTVATGDSGSMLLYELHITNLTPDVMALRRLEVVRGDTPATSLLTVVDTALTRILTRPGSTIMPSARLNIAGGSRAMVYLLVPVPTPAPSAVFHRLTFQKMRMDSGQRLVADSVPQALDGAMVGVDRNTPRIGAPLRGEWLAGNGPSNQSGHRRTQLSLGGNITIPQRFAIDFLQVDSAGNSFKGDRSKNANFIAYGKEVLAVGDGIVVQTKDSIPENTEGPMSRAVPVTLITIGGNHVVLDLGNDRFAFYAHLQPGSLRVRVGDRVKTGQVLGLVGNSGNSTEPHLHFHLVDAIAPGTSTLGAEGIPYALRSFELVGRCQLGSPIRCSRTAPITVRDAIPLQNQLVRFPP